MIIDLLASDGGENFTTMPLLAGCIDQQTGKVFLKSKIVSLKMPFYDSLDM